jgi:hypothetical protein
MKKLILNTIIYLSLVLPCFASVPSTKNVPKAGLQNPSKEASKKEEPKLIWRDARNEPPLGETQEEMHKYTQKYDKEFFIPCDQPKRGFKITAWERGGGGLNFLSLRCLDNKVDYEIAIHRALCNTSHALFIDLLDEDKFLVQTFFISNLNKNYTGTLLGNFEMNWKTFEKVKYFQFSLRSPD